MNLCPDGDLSRNSSKYLLIPKKTDLAQSCHNCHLHGDQGGGPGAGGSGREEGILKNRCNYGFPGEKRLCEYIQNRRYPSERILIFIICCLLLLQGPLHYYPAPERPNSGYSSNQHVQGRRQDIQQCLHPSLLTVRHKALDTLTHFSIQPWGEKNPNR